MKNDIEYLKILEDTKIFRIHYASMVKCNKCNYISRPRRRRKEIREKNMKCWNTVKIILVEKKEKRKKETLWKFILSYLSLLESDIGLRVTIVNSSLSELNFVNVIVTLLRERVSFDYNWEFLMSRGDWDVILREVGTHYNLERIIFVISGEVNTRASQRS